MKKEQCDDLGNIPDEVRRFILTSVASVPYLEAMLLLRAAPNEIWDGKRVAQRLYVCEKVGTDLLSALHEVGLLAIRSQLPASGDAHAPSFSYCPSTESLADIVDRLADIYSRNLIAVTDLIHANSGIKVQQFADAFKWRKDS